MDLSKLVVPEEAAPKARIVTCTIEGILEAADLRELLIGADPLAEPTINPPSLQVEPEDPSDLKKLREKHHSVARLIASGMTQRMVAQLSGYTDSYISILVNSPAMSGLIEMYRIQQGSAVTVVTEKLKTVGLKAVEKLEEKLELDTLDAQALLSLAKLGLDRGGHGPSSHSTQHIVNETVDHAKLVELNNSARSRSKSYIVPVSEVRAALAPPSQPGERSIEPEADDESR